MKRREIRAGNAQLQAHFLAEDEVARRDNQKIAIEHPLYLRHGHIVHVIVVLGLVQLVNEHAVWQLHGNLVAVHRDFLYVVTTLDPDFFF